MAGSALGDGNTIANTDSFNTGIHGPELIALLSTLRQEYSKLPAKPAEVARPYVEAIEAETKKEKPNKGFLDVTRKGLVEAVKSCAEMAPSLLKVAGAVADWFSK